MDMVDAGTRAVRRQYGTWPARQRALLLDPPVDNPRNIADFGLQEQHYMVSLVRLPVVPVMTL